MTISCRSNRAAVLIVAQPRFPPWWVVCSTRTSGFYAPQCPGERIFDFEITLFASHGPLTLGDTGGTLACLAETCGSKARLARSYH